MNSRIIGCLMTVLNRISTFLSSPVAIPASDDEPETRTDLTALERRQELLRHHTRMLARGMTNGLVVYGRRGGLGKTKCVIETLRAEQVEPVILNSHATALSFYQALHEHRDGVIVCDDCESLARSQACLGLLRSALWGVTNESRLVTYNSTSCQLKAPSSFNFSGQIILILNVMPKNNHCWDAVLSRCSQFSLDGTNADVIELARQIADRGYGDQLSASDCHEVIDFLEESSGSREISLRIVEPAFQSLIYSRTNNCHWEDLLESQLKKLDEDDVSAPASGREADLEFLRNALNSHDTIKGAEEAFIAATGKSRTSFYRLRRSLEKQDAAVDQTAESTSITNEESLT